MTTATANLQAKAAIWIDQIAGVMALAERVGKPCPDLNLYYEELFKLFNQELALSNLIDHSDLVLHADGPAIQDHRAALAVVTSLFGNVEKQIKRLAQSVLQLSAVDQRKAMAMLDVQLTGIAPGSLYAGFRIDPPSTSKLLGTEEENRMFQSVKAATLSVTAVPSSVSDKGFLAEELAQQVTDPAVRDSALLAAYHLSPTGRSGIVSIDLINPNASAQSSSVLKTSHRQLLREVTLKNPLIQSRTTPGTFTGMLNRIDLDKSRVDLRGIGAEGFDSIRCILPALTVDKAREILGCRVQVSGRYETTPNGKPSLMKVDDIRVIDQMTLT